MSWNNIQDLPEEDREPFSQWLNVDESSTYWGPDYERWKEDVETKYKNTNWKNIEELPEEDREPFFNWLNVNNPSTYWKPDYERWKKTMYIESLETITEV